jgi:rod shape determining protein RodA
LRSVDWVIVTLTLAIAALALINLNSAGATNWTGLVRDQMRFLAAGALAMTFAAALDYRIYYRMAYVLYGAGLLFLILVRLAGQEINHAKRWLSLGFFSFQPSELMKLFLILALSRYLHDLAARGQGGWKRLGIPVLMTLIPVALIVVQPHLSAAIVCGVIALILFAITELNWRNLLTLGFVFGAGSLFAYQFLLRGYQRQRIDSWLSPELYPDTWGYQILQVRIAVGNGGLLGQGIHQGTQNRLNFVPYKDSDFAFAVFAEEWGFVGTSVLLLLFCLLFLWSINVASESNERFGAVLAAGLGSYIFVHMVLNVGIVLEFLPNTGLPLPFVSYGGTSVVSFMIGLGILMSVSRARKWR